MINHIKILCLVVLSSLLLAQPSKVDSTNNTNSTEIPPTLKPVVEEIVTNSRESKEVSEQISNEMKKQIVLVKQIKKKISEIKKHTSNKKIDRVVPKESVKTSIDTTAIKDKEVFIEVEGQVVQWETKDRSWFGRLFHSNDVLFYPFIIDKDGNKIYLK